MAAHPILFVLLGLVAAAETGVLGYLFHKFDNQGYPSGNGTPDGMKVLLIVLMFAACWTLLFILAFICFAFNSVTAFMAGLAASLIWLIITLVLWAVGTALFHNARVGGQCIGEATISTCRQLETVEALGWAALGLTILCILSALFSWHSRRSTASGTGYGRNRGGAWRV